MPQGTRLGVLVFLAVVDMLCRDDESRVKYVDDLAMAEIINIRNQIIFAMQDKLDSLSHECKLLNMMTISSRSGAVVLVTGKQEAGINLGEILERWIFTILLLIIDILVTTKRK